MPGLHIFVNLPDEQQASYVFEEFPVRIGRAENNHLSILHPAVPRELCAAWLETDERTVRVEERPNLKNPLLHGKTRVEGGISGRRLNLRTGPVSIILSAEGMSSETKGKKGFIGVIAAVLLAVVLVVVAAGLPSRRAHDADNLFLHLPKTPMCRAVSVQCNPKTQCAERARLLRERSGEMLSRRKLSAADRMNAVYMLKEAAAIRRSLGVRDDGLRDEIRRAEQKISIDYQQEVMRLRAALKNQKKDEILKFAEQLKASLADCDEPVRKQLDRLISSNQEGVRGQ